MLEFAIGNHRSLEKPTQFFEKPTQFPNGFPVKLIPFSEKSTLFPKKSTLCSE